MILLLSAIAYCETITGSQTTQLTRKVSESIIIKDAIFNEIGNWATFTSAISFSQGSTSTSVELTHTMFIKCAASNGGSFTFDGSYPLKIEKIGVESGYKGSGQNAVIGRILTSGGYNINMSSFVKNTGGSRNLQLRSTPETLTALNVSGNSADLGLATYAYGNMIIDQASTTTRLTYSNFEADESSCGVLYYYSASGSNTVQHCNFVRNVVTNYGLIIPEKSSTLS